MKIINKYKNQLVIGAITILALIASMIIFYKLDNDGMNNYGIYNVKYKVYQNNKWSKSSRNGIEIGDKINPIKNIEISTKENEGKVYFYTYTNEWSEQTFIKGENNEKDISGIKMKLSDKLYKKYKVCYRTYNKKDKWLNWACSGEISGNKKEPITAIEIKIIPKNSVKFEYLKDYNKVLNNSENF